MKKCLVVGYGSIGRRHAEILINLGCDVILVTSQKVDKFACFPSVSQAMTKHVFDYVIVANSTHLHLETLSELIRCHHHGTVLVEKPLFMTKENLSSNHFANIFVAYNLRFSRPLLTLKKLLANDELVSFSVNVGQYLPTWRVNRDYRECYSAKKELGGGVLADLSHELDYCIWLCGKSLEVASRGGHFSDLQINSDDIYSILMRCQACPIVNLQINYLDRVKRRDIFIHTKKHSIIIDLVQGSLSIDGEVTETADAVAETYVRQHEAIMKGDFGHACRYEDGMGTLNLMNKITEANAARKWIDV